MAVNLGSAFVQVIPSLRGAQATITRQMGSIAPSVGEKFGSSFVGSFTKALAPLAGIVAGAAGIGAITWFITDSINSASDLQQSLGGVDAVFGKSAKQIHDWARGAQTSVGLSENAYNELASVIGSQLKNAGESLDKVGTKTNSLIGLGADLAATFGGTTQDAVESISAAFRGERDPIEKYGVSLNQATVDAEAASLGFKKVGGSLTNQANQAATLALIYKQTGAATGQFAKQSNTLAEKQQIFNATLENAKAKIGTALLPALTKIVGALSDSLGPALTTIQPLLDKFGDKAGTVGTDIANFITGLTGKKIDTGPIQQPVDKFTEAGQKLQDFITGTQPIVSTYLDVVSKLGPVIGTAFAGIGPAISDAFSQVGPALATALPPLTTAVVQLLPSLVGFLTSLLPILPPLAQILSAVAPVISVIAGALVFLVNNAVKPLVDNIAGMFTFFNLIVTGGFNAQTAVDGMNGKFGLFVQVLGTVGTVVGTVLGTIAKVIGTTIGTVARVLGTIIGNVAVVVGTAIGNTIKVVAALPHNISTAVSNIGTLLVRSGAALIEGFISGIRSRIGAVTGAVSGIMQKVRDFFPHSPAKRGPFSGAGWRQVATSGEALAKQFTGGFNDGVNTFAAGASRMIPDSLTGSVAGAFDNMQTAGTAVLINNKTNVRLEDLIDVRIAGNDAEAQRAQRMGYQQLVFG